MASRYSLHGFAASRSRVIAWRPRQLVAALAIGRFLAGRDEPRLSAVAAGSVVWFLLLAAVAGGCRPGGSGAEATSTPSHQKVAAEDSFDDGPEDPPYAPDSVFRPAAHRPPSPALPTDAVFADAPFTGRDVEPFSHFGAAVDLDGTWAVVGAPFADPGRAVDAGSAHVFEHRAGGWREVATLTAPRPAFYDHFGRSVAISGSVVVVGADGRDGDQLDAGAAFVFERRAGSFQHVTTLALDVAVGHAAFGFAVAAADDTIAVGVPGLGTGEVHVFRRRGGVWRLEARLGVDALTGRAGLGHAVDLASDGDRVWIVAGAPASGLHEVLAGAAFVFERRDGWQLAAELIPTSRGGGERFGRAVAVVGEWALVGAPRARVEHRTRAGAVWPFRRHGETWSPQPRIVAEPPRSDGEFGRTLALGRRHAVMGSQFSDGVGQATGGAELFAIEPSGWRRLGSLLAADPRTMNEFASSAAVGEQQVLLGAPRRGPEDNATGYVYTYILSDEPLPTTSEDGMGEAP